MRQLLGRRRLNRAQEYGRASRGGDAAILKLQTALTANRSVVASGLAWTLDRSLSFGADKSTGCGAPTLDGDTALYRWP